jgi:hypothetical protein
VDGMGDLAEWDSFYVIVASAAGGLIGLQFVVMTLIADRPPPRAKEASAAYATPTIIHFSTVLLLSALVRAPWRSIDVLSVLLALVGAAGMFYAMIVVHRMRQQTGYRPEREDWLCHALIPLGAYTLLTLSALWSRSQLRHALFGIGAAILLLLFTGIHNAWDAAAWHVLANRKGTDAERR